MNLTNFKDRHLLVAGEIGLDEYIFGSSHRISPEAPVPVVEVQRQSTKLGLAANVAQNISSLGAKTTLVSVRGKDKGGDEISSRLEAAGIGQSILIEDESRPTLRKVRILSEKQHVVRVDYEKKHGLDNKVAARFNEVITDLLPSVDGVILQDYGKGIWSPETTRFFKKAKSLGVPVFVDPSRLSHASLYRGTTLLSPNLQEAAHLAGQGAQAPHVRGNDLETLTSLGQSILKDTQAEHVIITCGPNGMVSLSENSPELNRIPTFAKEVFDVTGAGDTVIAVLALGYTSGLSLSECMRLANAAAGIVVGRVGTAFVTPEELFNGRSSNGRTVDSDSASLGSNPSLPVSPN